MGAQGANYANYAGFIAQYLNPVNLADPEQALADQPGKVVQTYEGELIEWLAERYGFEPVETPAIEYTDALGKFLPDQDRPNEGVFSFQDDDEQWLSLRYDLTAPLARYVAENWVERPYADDYANSAMLPAGANGAVDGSVRVGAVTTPSWQTAWVRVGLTGTIS